MFANFFCRDSLLPSTGLETVPENSAEADTDTEPEPENVPDLSIHIDFEAEARFEVIEMVEITADNESGIFPCDRSTRPSSPENFGEARLTRNLSTSPTDSACFIDAVGNVHPSMTSSSSSSLLSLRSRTETVTTSNLSRRRSVAEMSEGRQADNQESRKRPRLDQTELVRMWSRLGDDNECL